MSLLLEVKPLAQEPRSGTWQGWWRHGLREGHEALSLTIASGRVRGAGQDQDGRFSLEGEVRPDGTATLTKRYTQPLVAVPSGLAYQGQWNGRVIRGTWADEASVCGRGPFLLWPSSEERRAPATDPAHLPRPLTS
ncbi:hypothetical protein GETHOR_23610 [Geothrix oryzae]|uniref:Uncharacterized protein n=1 Tax=Geothrix oryzae TaxID=2927975 RepID=A0ABM8DTC4_9BACT|nr:hypothetical protein [Geothrix oryzae]BDU70260.1 hypothetical protein GETHOR_23610 [Geothrix oryzae]